MLSIKEMVAGKSVKLMHFCQDELWYVTEDGFEFPVPLSETGSAKWLPEDKAILFMRYIKKHVDFLANQREIQAA